SNLYIAETHICTLKETALTGSQPYEIAYETKSPALSFDIPKVTLPGMTTAMPLFVVEEDRDNGVIRVKLNANLPDDLSDSYYLEEYDCTPGFWVVSGNIRKFVQVDWIYLEKYVRILPDDMNIYISNIVNTSTTQNYYFDYATNAGNLKIVLSEFENNNKNQYNGTTNLNGVYLTICDVDKNPLSTPYPLQNLQSDENLLSTIGQLPGVENYPDDGFLCLSIVDPSNPTYFSRTISGTFTVTADGLDPDTANFRISPVPTVYTIHFRDVNNSWGMPHIYVYQPLEYNGYEVYGLNNENNANVNLNWLEYSFTGNMAFKGWKKDGGTINNLAIQTSDFNDGGGSPVKGYHVGTSWGNPSGGSGGTLPTDYYAPVTLVDYSKSNCTTCKNSGPFQLWPGGGMRKETIGGVTWWTIELPLLAKPEKALVMFTDGHDRDSGTRYPGGGVPGLPLPNYADREAWFLYNASDAVHEFSDDRPTSGGGGGGSVTNRKAALYWHQNNFGGATQMCLFTNKNDNWNPFWPENGSWTYKSAIINGEFRYLIFSTADELAAYDKLIDTNTSSGYEWSSSNQSDGKHSDVHKGDGLDSYLKSQGVTEAYQIWE
ncbi:MAG: hypothetical protein K2I91_04150, partial [Muribaculaceae bacterium]|nr:hypothetical protein [Muribaculaceae bacterium]